MIRLIIVTIIFAGSLFLAGQSASAFPPLTLERVIPLEGISGRIDHMAFDPVRNRLLIAELGNGSVDILDIKTGKAVHRITGLEDPQGIAYLRGPDLILAASGGDGTVSLFKAEDASPAAVIPLGADADNVRVNGKTGRVLVGYGTGGLAIFDAEKRMKIGDVALEAHPEAFELSPKTGTVFINVPDAGQIAVVDLKSRRQTATWKVPGLRSNFPMALDDAGNVLASVFRSPPRLVLLDTRSGAVKENIETCADADDVFFDAKRKRIYVSCGQGAVDVFQDKGAGYRLESRINTRFGARTSLFVPELDRLFVAARSSFLKSDAAILVFKP
jgi:DNA-binding beta-propeller fold protein YncE